MLTLLRFLSLIETRISRFARNDNDRVMQSFCFIVYPWHPHIAEIFLKKGKMCV